MPKDFLDESNVKFWLGPVSPEDCGCPMTGPHGLDCPEHPDRIAERELRAESRLRRRDAAKGGE